MTSLLRKGRTRQTVGRIRLSERRIRLAEGRICPPKTCVLPPPFGHSCPYLSHLRPLANVRALPSTVRAPYTVHARNAGVEIHLTFECAMSTYSINKG
jgi:hypothetical protein